MFRAPLFAVVTSLALAACARGGPPPRARADYSEASIRTARALGAERVPEAAPRLEAAKDNLARALRLIEEGETEKADGLLVRAEADAELAGSLAREAQLRADAEDVAARAHWGRR